MQFSPLTAHDFNILERERFFIASLSEFISPGSKLTGTEDDLSLLQKIFENRPYTEYPEIELIALGTAFGDLLAKMLDMNWTCYSDDSGPEFCLRYGERMIVTFPRNMIIKRVERDEEPDFTHLYRGVVQQIQKMIASNEYQ